MECGRKRSGMESGGIAAGLEAWTATRAQRNAPLRGAVCAVDGAGMRRAFWAFQTGELLRSPPDSTSEESALAIRWPHDCDSNRACLIRRRAAELGPRADMIRPHSNQEFPC